MRVVTRLAGLAAASLVLASAAQAQSCLGGSPFSSGSMNVTGQAQFAGGPYGGDGTSFGGSWNTSTINVLGSSFLGAGVMFRSPDGGDTGTEIGGHLGWERSTSSGIEWCPVVGVSYTSADPFSSLTLSGRVGLAKSLQAMSSYTLIGFGSAGLAMWKPDCDNCDSDTGAIFSAGVGFRFSNGMQISPRVDFSTFDNADPVLGVGVSFPLGKK